jgi:DNA-binding winged helix-turn-helix (wHTH) protein
LVRSAWSWARRRLTKDDQPANLGGRALDILIALLSGPNEVISKADLLSQVWRDGP